MLSHETTHSLSSEPPLAGRPSGAPAADDARNLRDRRADHTLLLWGDTQVGKTTLLSAAFFCEPGRLRAVDLGASAEALTTILFESWQNLTNGRLVEATSAGKIDLDLALKNGGRLRIRDVKGGLTREVARSPDARAWLQEASSVLFLVEWNADELGRQLNAIDGAWAFCPDKPRALVFTKVERSLLRADPAWQRRPRWWADHAWCQPHAAMIARFGDAVWPSSCFGYHEEQGSPAMILGEYGLVLPFGIRPRGVVEPIEWLLQRMGL